ncbi:hypothetical protein FZEAL_6168 [Fusarium zealandicum]|uniref:Uncharacterized protein n=1 Tax=Fusarium zealandicum TaxID=1053134 RepID=A0A8H4XJ50_9HYPO|nr:hypothetical protein FZEAL_6168 [Fusarium zealandicum]
MKVQALLAAAFATLALADMHPGAKELCGRLGPMEWEPEDLPDGVNPENVRMCADHPNGVANYWGYGKYMPKWVPRNPLADYL